MNKTIRFCYAFHDPRAHTSHNIVNVRRVAKCAAIIAACVATACIFATVASADGLSAMYVFGDSLSDIGNVYNNSTMSATWDFGLFGSGSYNGPALYPGPTPPTTSNSTMNAGLISNGTWAYTKGSWTDGSDTTPSTSTAGVWVQQLASSLSLPLSPSSSGGTDYAYGGATTSGGQTNITINKTGSGYTVTASATVNNITKQVGDFTASLGLAQANASALYVIWGGGNDMFNTVSAFAATEQTAMLNLTNNIQSLYNAGARNFLWPDLPPMASIPYYLGTNAIVSTAVSNACNSFKTDEETSIAALKGNDPGIKIAELDVLTLFTNLFTNPGSFTNITSAAQGKPVNPDKYIFWDTIHPTTAADSLIANAALTALNAAQIPEPSTMGLLLLAAALPLVLRRRKEK